MYRDCRNVQFAASGNHAARDFASIGDQYATNPWLPIVVKGYWRDIEFPNLIWELNGCRRRLCMHGRLLEVQAVAVVCFTIAKRIYVQYHGLCICDDDMLFAWLRGRHRIAVGRPASGAETVRV